jgi:hypothetical protein
MIHDDLFNIVVYGAILAIPGILVALLYVFG